MERKVLIVCMAVVLPATLLFSIILASRSLMDDQIGSCVLATHSVASMKDTEKYEMLGMYIAQQLKASGRTQLVPFYMPEVKQPRRKNVRLRPGSAHSHWKRVRRKGVFVWPVEPAKFWVSSYFGPRVLKGRKGFHQGVDLAARKGTPVVSAADGYVKEARYAPGYGNYILLVHPNGYKTRYAHLSRIRVRKNQRVRAGRLIGNVGATGRVTKSKWGKSASHLHFEVYQNGKRVNPFRFLG